MTEESQKSMLQNDSSSYKYYTRNNQLLYILLMNIANIWFGNGIVRDRLRDRQNSQNTHVHMSVKQVIPV